MVLRPQVHQLYLGEKMRSLLVLTLLCLSAATVKAEYASYGSITLAGLSRENSWPHNYLGESFSMVCNVNGPEGFLSVRTGPDTSYPIARNLKRLAILTVDTSAHIGNWVFVKTAHRSHSVDGQLLAQPERLPVTGWAHDGYLCDFLD